MRQNAKFKKTDEKSYPPRRNPDNYKPERVPAAFMVYAAGTNNSYKGETYSQMEEKAKTKATFYDSLQVRLVSDLDKSLAYYRDVLGCEVNYWGHAIRGQMKLILQQAKHPSDVKPNQSSAKRDNYPTDWTGPDTGWDTFVHINYDEFDSIIEEMKVNGANIILGPIEKTHNNGMTFKNLYIQDPDGYIIVFGQ